MQCGGSSGRTMTVENTGAKKVLTSEFSNWQRSSIACTSAGYRSARTSERINWRGAHDTCPSNTRPESLKQKRSRLPGMGLGETHLMTELFAKMIRDLAIIAATSLFLSSCSERAVPAASRRQKDRSGDRVTN